MGSGSSKQKKKLDAVEPPESSSQAGVPPYAHKNNAPISNTSLKSEAELKFDIKRPESNTTTKKEREPLPTWIERLTSLSAGIDRMWETPRGDRPEWQHYLEKASEVVQMPRQHLPKVILRL